jgi:hypothetical protein
MRIFNCGNIKTQTYALGRAATATPCSTKVKERVEFYLYSPFGTLACSRGTLPFTKINI